MASGKSSVGQLLAKILSKSFIDTDEAISQKVGMSISDFIEKFSIADFRKIETSILKEAIGQYDVLATGGGIVELEENRKLLAQEKKVVYLKTDFSIARKRISADKINKRPVFENSNPDELLACFKNREKYYQALSNYVVDTTDKNINEIVEILKKIEFV